MIETRFKKTDIGEVPEDWDIKMLGEIAPLQRGFDLPTSTLQNGVVPVIYSNGICNFHNRGICKAPGLVTGRSGTIGKFTFLSSGYYWPHNTTLWVTSFNNNSPLFVYYLYSFQKIEEFSSGSGVPTLNRNDVHKKRIPVPPFIEQQRIAMVLSDIDALLSNLSKKIEKKKLIKLGVMQQLLTGKKRLAGFTEPWREKRLGELCQLFGRIGFRGYTKADLVRKGEGAITFSPSDIHDNQLDYTNCTYISMFKYEESPEIKVYSGDIIFCKTASIGKCAIVKELNEKATINPQFVVMKNFVCSNVFLYYKLVEREFQERVKEITGGSTIPTMSQEKLKEQVLLMPTLSEQTVIAAILSDMDKEIEILEAKRTKYEQVKQGMMQQLLTGRIRLID